MKTRLHTDLQTDISQSSAVMAILNHLRLSAEKFGLKNFELLLDNADTGLMHLGLVHVDFQFDEAHANKIYRRFSGSASAEETASIINEVAELFDEHPVFNQFLEEFEAASPGKSLDLRNHLLAQAVTRILQVCVTQRHEAWFVEWQNLQEERNKVNEGEGPYLGLVQKKREKISTELLHQQENVKAKIEASIDLQRSVNKMVMHYEHANLGYKFRPATVPKDPVSKLQVLKGAKQIDLFNLNRDSRELLAALLEAYPTAKFFDAKDPITNKAIVYLVPDPSAKHPGQMRKIKLKDSLVRYTRKKNNKEERFAVCTTTPIGEGGYGVVYESMATLKMHYNKNGHIVGLNCKRKHQDKARVVKHFLNAPQVVREYEMMQKVMLLHVKEAVMNKKRDRAALVMRKAKGSALIDHVIADTKQMKSGKRKSASMFSLDQRIVLTIMIGEAIINQVHANNIIHRDLKPDNIMVELDEHNNPISVVVIDYGVAKEAAEATSEDVGTKLYRAPETKLDKHPQSDMKSDAYSFAVMLDEVIWANITTDEKFHDLHVDHQLRMKAVVQAGLHALPEDRHSVAEIISEFKSIKNERSSHTQAHR